MAFTKIERNRVAIIGASGYGGLQLVKLLSDHPIFEITYLGGEKSAGKSWNDLNPFINLENDQTIVSPDIEDIAKVADYVILSLPNGLSSQLTPLLLGKGLRVLDLSADYRFKSLKKWKQVYTNESQKYPRTDTQLCEEAVYGFSEEFNTEISESRLVACPGCYPTASLSLLIPFIKQGLIDHEGIVIDAKSGTSGGGRKPLEQLLLAESSESVSPT